jgi:hypothetical protein
MNQKFDPGRRLLVGIDEYTITKAGVEIQILVIGSAGYFKASTFSLGTYFGGVWSTTKCISLKASSEDVQKALNSMFWQRQAPGQSGFNKTVSVPRFSSLDQISVTRSGRGIPGNSFIYSIYFEGKEVVGDFPLLNASHCAGAENVSVPALAVTTAVQGGATAHQRLVLSVDDGYIEGPFVRLYYAKTREFTPCLRWGTEASTIESALNDIRGLTDYLLPITFMNATTIFPRGQTRVYLSSGFLTDGLLYPGDVVRLDGIKQTFAVTSVDKRGTYFDVNHDYIPTDVVNGSIRVVGAAAKVRRSGTGNSTIGSTVISMSADNYVKGSSEGNFKLKVLHNGAEETTRCLRYGISASELEEALGDLYYDFNRNSIEDDSRHHVKVIRKGNGNSSWGFGFEYHLSFSGPMLNEWSLSSVLGPNTPIVEFSGYGRKVGCEDFMKSGAAPNFAVEMQAGVAAFTYDIYFTNPRLSNIPKLSVNTSACTGWSHLYGMSHDANLDVKVHGGSPEVQILNLSSMKTSPNYRPFALFFGRRSLEVPAKEHFCFDWTVSGNDIANSLNKVIKASLGAPVSYESQVEVSTSERFGGPIFTITFFGDLVK